MSTNGTQPTRVCVWELALEAWIARTERPPNLVEDGVFAVYLRSQKSPQAFRYLRRWLTDGWPEASLVSYEEITSSLAEERVIASLKGKGLAELTELAMRAQNAVRDLNKAFDAYREVLGGQEHAGGSPDSGPAIGADDSADAGDSECKTASKTPNAKPAGRSGRAVKGRGTRSRKDGGTNDESAGDGKGDVRPGALPGVDGLSATNGVSDGA